MTYRPLCKLRNWGEDSRCSAKSSVHLGYFLLKEMFPVSISRASNGAGHQGMPLCQKKHTQDVEIGSDSADLCFHMEMKLRFRANRTRIHPQRLHCWKVAMMGTFRPILESPPPSPQTSTDFARDDGVRWSWWTRKKWIFKSLSPPCLLSNLSNLSTFLPYSLSLSMNHFPTHWALPVLGQTQRLNHYSSSGIPDTSTKMDWCDVKINI